MPNKLTDSGIIKALECCKNDGIVCSECPYKKTNGCMEKLSDDALDLINRLQAKVIKEQNKNSKLRNERNRLQAKLDEAEDTIQFADKELKKANTEIERLEKDSERLKKVEMQLDDMCKMYNVIKAEAYKEFAERLKKSIKKSVDDAWHSDGNGIYDAENVLDDIDNLLKETGGDKE